MQYLGCQLQLPMSTGMLFGHLRSKNMKDCGKPSKASTCARARAMRVTNQTKQVPAGLEEFGLVVEGYR